MKKFFIAAIMIAATMSANAMVSTSADEDDVDVEITYGYDSSTQNKAAFYMYALDSYGFNHYLDLGDEIKEVQAFKKALAQAYQANDEAAMEKMCKVIDGKYPTAIEEARVEQNEKF